eukprot:Rhum_TRINITY_DN14332_c1_g1::Rhum_TRINITY_DN14332_c1_g1_i1::g.80537::m.80537
MGTRLDALETSMGDVFRRLNLDTLTEQAEKLKQQQEQLQLQMAQRNQEYNSKSRPPAAAAATTTAAAPVTSAPVVPLRGVVPRPAHSPARPASRTEPAAASSPLASSPALSTRPAHSPSTKTYARASEALQKAREARGVAAAAQSVPRLSAATPAAINLASPGGALTSHTASPPSAARGGAAPLPPPPPPSGHVPQSRAISPVRGPLTDASRLDTSKDSSLSASNLFPGPNLLAIPTPVLPYPREMPAPAAAAAAAPQPSTSPAHTLPAVSPRTTVQRTPLPSVAASVAPSSHATASAAAAAALHDVFNAQPSVSPQSDVDANAAADENNGGDGDDDNDEGAVVSSVAYEGSVAPEPHSSAPTPAPAGGSAFSAPAADAFRDLSAPPSQQAQQAPGSEHSTAALAELEEHKRRLEKQEADTKRAQEQIEELHQLLEAATSSAAAAGGGAAASDGEAGSNNNYNNTNNNSSDANPRASTPASAAGGGGAGQGDDSSSAREREREHKEQLRAAYEIHVQQQNRIEQMEQILSSAGVGGGSASVAASDRGDVLLPHGDAPSTPVSEGAVLQELRRIHEQSSSLAERLQAVERLRSASPVAPSQASSRTPVRTPLSAKKKPSVRGISPGPTWSPSSRGPSKQQSNASLPRGRSATATSADFASGGGGGSNVSIRIRGQSQTPGQSSFEVPQATATASSGRRRSRSSVFHDRAGVGSLGSGVLLDDGGGGVREDEGRAPSQGRGSEATTGYSVDRFGYTKAALRDHHRRSSLRGSTGGGDGDSGRYAFGSTLRIKIEPTRGGRRSRASSAASRRAPPPTSAVAPPPNRHRLENVLLAVTRGEQGADLGGRRGSGAGASRPSPLPGMRATELGERASQSPDGCDVGGADAVRELVIPLPECCRDLPLADGGVTPATLRNAAQVNLQEVATYYAGWLGGGGLETEEAAAVLALLPLSSLPADSFVSVCGAVSEALARGRDLTLGGQLSLLRAVRLLATAKFHDNAAHFGALFATLVGMLRDPGCTELVPRVVTTLLAFGARGLGVLLKEASGEPPDHETSLQDADGGVSGWNSCLLTLIANQPCVVRHVVIPLILRDLRDGTQERAEAACNALVGLQRHRPPVLGQLGEALVAGKIDRRVVCTAIRVLGGADGVSLLQSLLGHHSHRVRQAAVWGLGLHAPEGGEPNPDFDFRPGEHQPRPPFGKLSARCTCVVHAELPSLELVRSPKARLPPPVLYFQPQLDPECPPHLETHIIVDSSVMLQQCSEVARSGELDLSIGQTLAKSEIPDIPVDMPTRPQFIRAAYSVSKVSEEDTANMMLFLTTFSPITEGRGILSPSLRAWQKKLRTPSQPCISKLPHIPRATQPRIVSALSNVVSAGGDAPQDLKVKEEALHVLRWFAPEVVEPCVKSLKQTLHGPHPTLRSGVVVLLSELVRQGCDRGAVTDIVGLLTSKLNDPHPRVRLACVVALRSTSLPASLLPALLRFVRDGKINRYQVAHTAALVVPKGVQALVDAARAQSIEAGTRKACMYGLGKIGSADLHHKHPQLNEAVAECLASAAADDGNSAEVREQALLSLACFAGVVVNPLSPPQQRPSAPRDLQSVGDTQRKGVLAADTAAGLVHADDPRLRATAAVVLAMCGKRGVCTLQEIILKKQCAVAAARLTAVRALPHVPNKATLYKTALLASNDVDSDVRHAALDVMFSCPVEQVAIDLRRLPTAQIDEVRNSTLDVLNSRRHLLTPMIASQMHALLDLL